MSSNPACLAYGFAISFVVSVLKKIPLVKRFPKAVSFVLSALSAVLMTTLGATPGEWKTIALCVLEQFAAAVVTHEAVVEPIRTAIGNKPDSTLARDRLVSRDPL